MPDARPCVFALVLAVLATPLGTEAQEAGKVLRIGYLTACPRQLRRKKRGTNERGLYPQACEAVFMTADRIIQ